MNRVHKSNTQNGTQMSLKLLRQHLKTKERKELIDEIADLYKKFPDVKNYYQASAFNDDQSVLNKYKTAIKAEFFPESRYAEPPCRLSVAKKAISDYKKVSCSDPNLADIMLFYVECGVEFTNTYGDINDRFYSSMESQYAAACEFIIVRDLQNDFQKRAYDIVTETVNCGWGFHDSLAETYYSYFNDHEE
tara:strand:+ start:13771 stop:14343 length:573 start_codon:yes stop_codon:yes gene_type:complete